MTLYRRLLDDLEAAGVSHVYSHQLARLAGVSAAQVRRDLMSIGYSGSPKRGYEVDKCLASIASFLEGDERQDVALVGAGRLGRSILAHFAGRRPMLRFAAVFDTDPALIGTSVEGCRCYSVDVMEDEVRRLGLRIGVIAVPPERAQKAASTLIRAGVHSIVSFAPAPLRVPEDVYIDYVDITTALESAAYFARAGVCGQDAQETAGETDAEPVSIPKDLERLLARTDMKLEELAERIGATVLTPGKPGGTVITRVYAGDRVSDLLNAASDSTLLISNLASVQMLRVAELMDVPGICFVDNAVPDGEMIELAKATDTLVMVSPSGVYETCGLIYNAVAGEAD